MKCLSYLRSFLPVVARPQWAVFLKACLVRLPMLVSRNTKWKWRESAETISLLFNFNNRSTAVLVVLSLVLLVVCSLLSGCVRSHSSLVSPPSTQAFHSSQLQTLREREKENFYSDSSVFQQSKPLWLLPRVP